MFEQEQNITGQGYYEKTEKVLGGFQKPSARKGMELLFNELKEKGFFKGFPTYDEWEKNKYEE